MKQIIEETSGQSYIVGHACRISKELVHFYKLGLGFGESEVGVSNQECVCLSISSKRHSRDKVFKGGAALLLQILCAKDIISAMCNIK
jgi:hypothetical protein